MSFEESYIRGRKRAVLVLRLAASVPQTASSTVSNTSFDATSQNQYNSSVAKGSRIGVHT